MCPRTSKGNTAGVRLRGSPEWGCSVATSSIWIPHTVQSIGETYGEYGYGAFGSVDLPRLKAALSGLDRRGVHFMLSYALDRRLAQELGDWNRRTFRVHRHVAGFADRRKTVNEMLLTNY